MSLRAPVCERRQPLLEALIREDEGITVVLDRRVADDLGLPYDFIGAWLTLTVYSSLEAVGLTAAFSAALGEAQIPANVLAGLHHDHIVVPIDRADDAIRCLAGLRVDSVAQ
ncbi:MAG: ACT domain-containing protein [Acidimicrobiales bacterium]